MTKYIIVALLLLLTPALAWCQTGPYTADQPYDGGYFGNGVPWINNLLHPPPPDPIKVPLQWGEFHCKFAEGKNQWVYTVFHYEISPPFKIVPVGVDQPSGKECDPSGNGQGGPLSNSDSMATFRPTLGGLPSGQISAHATAALPAPGPEVPRFTEFVRGLPYFPNYSPALLPNAPPCDPNTASHIFAVNHSSDTVTHLNSCNFQVLATIPVATRPLQVAITPDDRMAIVTSFDNAITFIDTSTNKVLKSLSTDFNTNPSGIAISPDGTRAYVTSFNNTGSTVSVVDIQQAQILSQISVDAFPQSVFLSPDGSVAYVTFPFGNQVRLIDTLTGLVFSALPISGTYGVAFNSTGTRAYITTQSGSVQVVDTATYSIIQSIPLTVPPDEIKITPDDQWLLVNSYLGKASIIIDTTTGETVTTVANGPPHGLVIVQ